MDSMDSMLVILPAVAHALALISTPISVVFFAATQSLENVTAFHQQQDLTAPPVELGFSGMKLVPAFRVIAVSLEHWIVTAVSPQDSVCVPMKG